MRYRDLFAFIKERHAIYERRTAGKPKPWTKDPILQAYRFCNVYRELDTVTQWIAQNWRVPHEDDPNIWFAMAVARLVNWPDTMQAIGYPSPWKSAKFLKVMEGRRSAGEKMYTGAYMIHSGSGFNNAHIGTTYDYQESKVFSPLWADRKNFPMQADSLREIFNWLKKHECYGDFMAAQVIADVKYAHGYGPADVTDWDTFAAPGPGSMRGLARVARLDTKHKWKEAEWQEALAALKTKIDPLVDKAGMPPIHAQDLQNCLCEFDKYERVRLGEGRPRSLYPGAK